MALTAPAVRAAPPVPWRSVWASWLAGRALVLLAALVATPLAQALGQPRSPYAHGLLGWDAAWYDGIARHGYGGLPVAAYRFFPLVPALARLLGGHHTGTALIVLSNAAALAFAVLVHQLAVDCGLSAAEAKRAVWAGALMPAGFVLVMGYTEAVFGCLVAGFLLALSRGHGRWLLVLGLLAGLARPTGFLLAVPAAVVAARGHRPQARAALVGVVAPFAGLAGWLLCVGLTTGHPLLPFTLQSAPGLRGGTVVNTAPQLLHALAALPHLSQVLLHGLALLTTVAVIVAARRRLRPEHLALVLATVAVAMTASKLGSFERYVGSAAPVLLAVGVVTARPPVRWLLTGVSATCLVVYAGLAFAGGATP